MPNFVYDDVEIPLKKEIDPVPDGAGDLFFGSDDWNTKLKPWLEDIRAAILDGVVVGFAPQDATPDVDGASVFNIFVRSSDNHLIYNQNGTLHDITAGGGGGGGSLQDAYDEGAGIQLSAPGDGGNGPVVISAAVDGSTDSLFEVMDRNGDAIINIEDNGTGGVVGIRHMALTGVEVVATGGNTGDVWTYDDDAGTWTPQPPSVPSVAYGPVDIAIAGSINHDICTPTSAAGDFTTGAKIVVLKAKTCVGVRCYWAGGATTLRAKLWDVSGGGPALKTVDVVVGGAGEKLLMFAAGQLLTQGKNYFVTVYDTSAAHYTSIGSNAARFMSSNNAIFAGPDFIWNGFTWFKGGDNAPDTEDGVDQYPVEPILV